MTLRAILDTKGSVVYTILPGATLEDAARDMARHNVGSLLVCGEGEGCEKKDRLLGIITERDLLHAVASGKTPPSAFQVSTVMSTVVVTAAPDDAIEQAMGLMTARRIRHLPVVEEGRLLGLVSIGDVVKAQYNRLAMENRFMKDYIRG